MRAQDARIAELEAQLKWFQNQIFGRKSERRLAGDSKYIQLTLGSLLEEETPPAPTETVKEYQRRVKPEKLSESGEDESGLRFSSDVPVKTIPLKPEEVADLKEGEDYEAGVRGLVKKAGLHVPCDAHQLLRERHSSKRDGAVVHGVQKRSDGDDAGDVHHRIYALG